VVLVAAGCVHVAAVLVAAILAAAVSGSGDCGWWFWLLVVDCCSCWVLLSQLLVWLVFAVIHCCTAKMER